MNNWILWFIIASFLITPIVYLFDPLRKAFLSWRVPITLISALPERGWAQVTGRAKGTPIQSSFTKSNCIYWQLEVQRYQSGSKGGGRWQTIHKSSSGSIELDDMTGRIRILDFKPQLVLSDEYALEKLNESEKSYLESIGIKTKGFLGFNPRLRIFERTIAPGEELLVLGKLKKAEGTISMSAGAIDPLVISNLSKPEMIKAIFWSKAKPLLLTSLIGLFFIGFLLYTLMSSS